MKLSSQQLTTTLVPRVPGLQLMHLRLVGQGLLIAFSATAAQGRCPLCNTLTSAQHSNYSRSLADLPWGGFVVHIQLNVRKFFCKLAHCPRRIFTERVSALAAPYARRTTRLASILNMLGFALGARPAARLAARLSIDVSPSTLLQIIRRVPPHSSATLSTLSALPAPRIIGLDDFAFRKGQSYGTILVDLETRRPLDVLPDRTAATVAAWLRQHPSIQVVSRDRSTEYTRAITLGAPHARQIADRFHIIKNLREALERLIDRNRGCLAGVTIPRQPRYSIENELQSGVPTYAERKPAKRGPAQTSRSAVRQEERQVRVTQVRELRSQGISIKGIAQQLGINRQTVYRYLRSDTDPTVNLIRQKPSIIDKHMAYLHERWQAGCENGLQLWREIQERGYYGSRKMVAVWVSQQRQEVRLNPGDSHCLPGAPPKCKEFEPQSELLSNARAKHPERRRTSSIGADTAGKCRASDWLRDIPRLCGNDA